MPTFEITAPDGRKYRVTGENAEGALQALQTHVEAGMSSKEAPKAAEADDALSMARTGLGGFIEGIPIAGPMIRRGTEMAAAATLAPFSDMTYGEIMGEIDKANVAEKTANPGIDIGSQLAGSVAATLPVAATATGAKLLGVTGGNLLKRAGASAASGAGIAAADQAARNFAQDGAVSPEKMVGSGLVGGGLGAAIPVVGAAGSKAIGAAANKAGDFVRSVLDPTKQAARNVGQAIDVDRAAGNALPLRDIVRGRQNAQPLINADLGGETTRALTRAAANQSPEARGAINRVVQDRFASQSDRLVKKVTDLAGGKIDDLAAIDSIRDAASRVNQPAYKATFAHPNAQVVFTKRLQELMQAPAIRSAVKTVPKRSANRGAVEGFKEIPNPFDINSRGDYVLRRRADGSMIAPSLQFWDQVKRNLDGMISSTKDRSMRGDLTALKKELVKELDAVVPQYASTRQGAARFFGAEDAVDAGRQFLKSTRMLPEYQRGVAAMSAPERELFKVGAASEIIDMARSASDRQNVIGRYFSSPESRQKMVMAFGKDGARDFEAFVRVENAMDMLRGALGNSTTARQLIESGIGGAGLGGATWWYTGDLNSGVAAAAVGAAGRFGARAAGKKINENVMKQTAEMLLSSDPKVIQRAIKMAARSPQYMAAIDAITKMIGVGARGTALQVSTE